MDAAEDRGVAQRHAVAKTTVERLLEERRLVDVGEDFGDRLPGYLA